MKKTNLKNDSTPMGFKSYLGTHKKVLFFAALGFILLCLVALAPALVQAQRQKVAARDQLIQEKNMAIEEAIMNNDYNAWSNLVTDESLTAQLNSSNFGQFVQIYRLLQQGKVEEAGIIKKQLNLKQDFIVTTTKSSMIDVAIEKKDYNKWRDIVGAGWEPSVTEANFSQYAGAYALLAKGKLKQADVLKQALNLKEKFDYTSSR